MAPRPCFEKLQRLYKITPSRSDEMAKNDLAIRVYCNAERFHAEIVPQVGRGSFAGFIGE